MRKIILMVCLMMAMVSAKAETAPYDFIQASGEGEMKIKPDYAMISATIFSRAMQAQAAQKMNAKEMARIDKVLRQDLKVDAKDIQTSSFQVTPQYEYLNNKTVYKGMTVSHTVTIKYRKIDDIGSLLDRLVEGQNQEGFGVRVEGISFGSDQLRALQSQVLEQAVQDAKTRATVLAKASGRKLKEVRKISDSQIRLLGVEPVRSMKMSMMAAEDAAGGTAISPGELSVIGNVQIEFEIQ